MSPLNDPATLLSNPEWLPSHWNGDAIQLVQLQREQHGAITFLSDEYIGPLGVPSATLSMAAVATSAPPGAPHYIFHSAFAASTLLARALDVPGVSMGLKEPQILNELAEAARRRSLSSEALKAVVQLLARPFGPGEKVIVKPSNVANLLAPSLLELDPGSHAVFLYAPLERFLRSIADKGLFGRRWARKLYPIVARDTGLDLGLSDREQFELTDLQVAAVDWLMQHAQGAALMTRFPGRARWLESDGFLGHRGETIIACAAHFGLALADDAAREIADGPAFATHSKEIGRAFDPEEPLQPKPAIPVIDEEIAMVSEWARQVARQASIPMEFSTKDALLAPR